jgi:hypothetical protein
MKGANMPEAKDIWSKLETVAKILTPVLVFALGTYYTYQQQQKSEAEKRFDRYISLGKSLSSENPIEQKLAMLMLKKEKEKYPDEVPDELLSMALPQLVNLAATNPDSGVANQAKQLALDLSKNIKYSAPIQQSIEKTPARIYFHIQDESQRENAKDFINQLQSRLGTNDFIIPGIQLVSVGPNRAELRYFRASEAAEANRIDSVLIEIGMDAKSKYVRGYENSSGIRSRHYEVWLGPVKK